MSIIPNHNFHLPFILSIALLPNLGFAQEWKGFPGLASIVNDTPLDVTTGDFNGDGIIDIVAGSQTVTDVLILLGKGDGTFSDPVAYATGNRFGPSSVTTGDFNGDGITDLVAATSGTDNITVLLGNGSGGIGDGTFSEANSFYSGNKPYSIATSDFNGDGIADLVTSNTIPEGVSVLLGNGTMGIGDGTFDAPVNYNSGDGSFGLRTGDFNGDGITDLATANFFSSNVSVLLGNGTAGVGNGTFSSAVNYGIGNRPRSLESGDFNGDGVIDLATANPETGNISVLLGDGNGTFGDAISYIAGTGTGDLTTGDFNGDGVNDLLTSNAISNDVSLLLGNGSGGIGDGTFQTPINYAVGYNPRSLTTGDFNGDGITDLASACHSTTVILLGNGAPGRGDDFFASSVNYAAGYKPKSVTKGDFNSDGVTDLAIANEKSNDVSVLLGLGTSGIGDGTFADPVNYTAGDGPANVTTGDFNDDGISDLAISNKYSDDVSILLGNGTSGTGDGTFMEVMNYAAGDWPNSVTMGDFNNNGVTDLAIANISSDNVSVLLGNGDGTFSERENYVAGDYPGTVRTGDFNNDGITDLVTANTLSGNVSVFQGNGNGTFAAAVHYNAGENPQSVTTGDFNNDGITDLATADLSEQILVLLGNGSSGIGDGTFAAPVSYIAAYRSGSITTADFNDDGITDLVTVNEFHNIVSVLLGIGSDGKGDGTFASPRNFNTGNAPISVLPSDFNGDGNIDLVTANQENNNVTILLNLGFTDPVPVGMLTY